MESNLVDVRSHAGCWRHLGGDDYEHVLVEIMPAFTPSPAAAAAVSIAVPHAFFRLTLDESAAVTGFSQSPDGSGGFPPNYASVCTYNPADGGMLGQPVTRCACQSRNRCPDHGWLPLSGASSGTRVPAGAGVPRLT